MYGQEYVYVTFEDLYAAHLTNLMYPNIANIFQPSAAFKHQWMIMLSALINKPKTVYKLCSHYWFNEKIARTLTASLDYSRGFRILLSRFNPYNAGLKCREPFNYARVVFDLSKGREVVPSGFIAIKAETTIELPPTGADIGPLQPPGYLSTASVQNPLPVAMTNRIYDVLDLADNMHSCNQYLVVDILLKHRYLIHMQYYMDERLQRWF